MAFTGTSFNIVTGSFIADVSGANASTTGSGTNSTFDVGVIKPDPDDLTSFFISSSTGTDDNFVYLQGGS